MRMLIEKMLAQDQSELRQSLPWRIFDRALEYSMGLFSDDTLVPAEPWEVFFLVRD
jgi:hypothetical protein